MVWSHKTILLLTASREPYIYVAEYMRWLRLPRWKELRRGWDGMPQILATFKYYVDAASFRKNLG